MITLKGYQVRVLDSLERFFVECVKETRPEAAFQTVQLFNGRTPDPYIAIQAPGLAPGTPYICLRVPTGGGKTLLACHAAGIAIHKLLEADRAVVLWLVPSNTILKQTVEALRDRKHDYRRALEMACGAVEVVTIEEALRLTRGTVDGNTVVIVSTIQSFRAEDTTGRKVYDQNGAFSEHLLNVPADRLGDLEIGVDGKPKPSLVNMLRLRRPVVIVDEAHNARTELSFTTLGNVSPSCIIEFSATPARTKAPSNVLHHVSASELKVGNMVKLPLRVVTRHPGQADQLLTEAISLRADLEKLAGVEGQLTGEYLRPILLIQAERVDGCEPLRARLAAEFGIAKDQISISTGEIDDLPGTDEIRSPECPVRFVITVQKLREGWDCPFAYVLCSLRVTRSAVAIEQIVGRILRLPGAQPKRNADLNCSYVLSVSPTIQEVLSELRDALQSNGFTTAEAERIIVPVSQGMLPLGLQGRTTRVEPSEIDEAVAKKVVEELQGKVEIIHKTGEVTVLVPLSKGDFEKLESCFKSAEAKAKVEEAADTVRQLEQGFGGTGETRIPSPYERGEEFVAPKLCVLEGGSLFEFDDTYLLEQTWTLSAKDASLPESYNPRDRLVGDLGTVDVDIKGKVLTGVATTAPNDNFISTLHQQVLALGIPGGWTLEALIVWLDRHIDHTDITGGESAIFLGNVIRGLMTKFGIADVSELAEDRFRLRDQVEARIQLHRDAERGAAFQMFLMAPERLTVSEVQGFDFRAMGYEPSWSYQGGFQFRKHYFGSKPGELAEKTFGGGDAEEFLCAQLIDALPQVKWWVRNLARKQTSFRLLTSKDWFYPDFICELNDGHILTVEYKGDHLWAGAEEKRNVGAVWASRSKGRCTFVMPRLENLSDVLKAAVAKH